MTKHPTNLVYAAICVFLVCLYESSGNSTQQYRNTSSQMLIIDQGFQKICSFEANPFKHPLGLKNKKYGDSFVTPNLRFA